MNTTLHIIEQLKWSLLEVKIIHILILLMIKIPTFPFGNHVKDLVQIGLKKFLWLKKLKILFQGHMVLMISMVKKLLEHFMINSYKKQIKKDLG